MKPSDPSLRQEPLSINGVFHLTWIGPTDGHCAPMLERVREVCFAQGRRLREHYEPLDSAVLHASLQSPDSPVVAWADRIIIACETRLDYPWRVVELLERLDSPVPWGVATGSWHAGSRRTGVGTVTHWQLPWYRWWDGWYGWLFPELSRPGSRCVSPYEPVTLPIDLATPAAAEAVRLEGGSSYRNILIVAACPETRQAWQLAAARVGWNSQAESPSEMDSEAKRSVRATRNAATTRNATARATLQTAAPPDCILWDDSCQDRLPGSRPVLDQACRQVDGLRRRHPGVPIVVGLALGHLPSWSELKRAGASDFIIKPSFGLPLADYLWALVPSAGAR